MTNPLSSARVEVSQGRFQTMPVRLLLSIPPHQARRSMSVALLLALFPCLFSCTSSKGRFRVENPFPDESQAIANWSSNRKKAKSNPDGVEETDDSERVSRRNAFFGPQSREKKTASRPVRDPEPEPSPSPYYGRGDHVADSGSESLFPGRGRKPEEEAPETLDSETIYAAPAPGSGDGKPCYRCNGKGYRLSSLALDAKFVTCQSCGGSGRR